MRPPPNRPPFDRELALSALWSLVGFGFIAFVVAWTVSNGAAECGVKNLFRAELSPCRWSIQELTYRDTLDFPGLGDQEVAGARRDAYDAIQAACGIRFRPAAPGEWANLVAEVTSLPPEMPDALAFASVACDGGPGHAEWQRYNQESYWDRARVYAASLHELGHNLGLPHDEDPLSMMRPVLDDRIAGPGPTDVAGLQARYGRPGEPMPDLGPAPSPFGPPTPPRPAPPPKPDPKPTPTPSPTPMPNPPGPLPSPQDPFTEAFELPMGTQHATAFRREGDAMVASFYIPRGGYRTVVIRTFGVADAKLTLASKTRVLAENEKGAPDGRNAKITWKLPQGNYTARVECVGQPGRCVVTVFISEPAR
jgi:hypothetical protein